MEYFDIPELKTSYSNGCEVDLTISEGTDETNLKDFLRHYANDERNIGGNILSSEYSFWDILNSVPHKENI